MLILPDKCLRDIPGCQPYSQIASDDEPKSFFCCGERDKTIACFEQDKYCFCFNGELDSQLTCFDKRDLAHQMSVIAGALAVIEEMEAK